MDHRELLFLRALREAGVLDALVTSAGTSEEVAADTAVSPTMAKFVLQTLSALGYLTQVDGTYEPTTELLGILTTKDVRSIGTLPARLDDADRLVELGTRLRGGEVSTDDEEELVNGLGAAAARDSATVRAVGTAVLRGSPDVSDAVVFDGAPGRLAVELAARGVDVTLLDDPTALSASEGVLSGTQVSPLPTSDVENLLPSGLVVVAPGFKRDPRPRDRLLQLASDTVATDGRVVLVDRFHDENEQFPLASVMDVARTGAVRDRSNPAVRTALERVGLSVDAIDPIPGTDFVAVRSVRSGD